MSSKRYHAVDDGDQEMQPFDDDILNLLKKKQCKNFKPLPTDRYRCECGHARSQHKEGAIKAEEPILMEESSNVGSAPGGGIAGLWNTLTGGGDSTDSRASAWSMERDIEEEATDAFGSIEFVGVGQQMSEYVRLADDTNPKDIHRVITELWELDDPQFMVSIIGGAKSFDMSKWRGRWKRIINDGIVKVARQTGAWVITGGTNSGVMKAVGDAVKHGQSHGWEHLKRKNEVRCIGITSWGYVDKQSILVNSERQANFVAEYKAENLIKHGKPVSLNPNHTHFLLVDDGTRGFYRGKQDGEHMFRARFETYMKDKMNVPCVRVLVGAEHMGFVDQMLKTLKRGVPVVVCVNTGTAGDILAEACKWFADLYQGIEEGETSEEMEYDIRNSLRARLKGTYPYLADNYAELENALNKLVQCCTRENIQRITLFDLNERDDLDVAILNALFKLNPEVQTPPVKKLEFAYKWNRVDLAKFLIDYEYSKALDEMDSVEERITDATLCDLFINSLKDNKLEFVEMLLTQGLYLKEYVNILHLLYLYNQPDNDGILHRELQYISKKLPVEDCIVMPTKTSDGAGGDVGDGKQEEILEEVKHMFLLQHISMFFVKLVGEHDQDEYQVKLRLQTLKLVCDVLKQDMFHSKVDSKDKPSGEPTQTFLWAFKPLKTPVTELFLWACITGRQDLAKVLWYYTEHGMTSALAASHMLKSFAWYFPLDISETKDQYYANAEEFSDMANGLLDECFSMDRSLSTDLIARPVPRWGAEDCMDFAGNGHIKNFLAHSCCQNSLTNTWKQDLQSPAWRMLLAIMFPFLILTRTIRFLKPYKSLLHKVIRFYSLPVIKFALFMMSQLIFVVLFSYFILFDLQNHVRKEPTVIEIILIVWTTTLLLEEVRQISLERVKWLKSIWNIIDCTAVLFSIIAFIVGFFHSDETSSVIRTLYSLSCLLWYCRLCNIYLSNAYFGPLLIMILRMLKEVVYFLMVLSVFLVGYGVASQALMYPRRKPSWEVFKHILYFPFWNLLGELNLDEVGGAEQCDAESSDCPVQHSLVIIMLAAYMLFGNVLMINLLIAVFSHIFEVVKGDSVAIWKSARYFLVTEYKDKPFLPPPFIVFPLMWRFGKYMLSKRCTGEGGCCPKTRHRKVPDSTLQWFESDCLANYMLHTKEENKKSPEEMLKTIMKIQSEIDQERTENKDRQRQQFQRELLRRRSSVAGPSRIGLQSRRALPARMAEEPPMSPVPEEDDVRDTLPVMKVRRATPSDSRRALPARMAEEPPMSPVPEEYDVRDTLPVMKVRRATPSDSKDDNLNDNVDDNIESVSSARELPSLDRDDTFDTHFDRLNDHFNDMRPLRSRLPHRSKINFMDLYGFPGW
ncbi:unnamed protein product [Owenia fusiformis]|uniref:Uncharacterized protein n=1 Tax=Owenia fusiformis TaxID=6347 RepID=A0A8S4NRY5_OWEFU|nr:unnamed protein product [Owenia fusiformis]